MFENNIKNLNLDANIQQTGDNVGKKKISFKGNPNAVDTTPVADTYQTQPQPNMEIETQVGVGTTIKMVVNL